MSATAHGGPKFTPYKMIQIVLIRFGGGFFGAIFILYVSIVRADTVVFCMRGLRDILYEEFECYFV